VSQLVTGEAVALDLRPAALPSRLLAGVLDVLLQFLAPELAATVNPVLVTLFVVCEGWMLFYLLIRGVRTIRPAEQGDPLGVNSATH